MSGRVSAFARGSGNRLCFGKWGQLVPVEGGRHYRVSNARIYDLPDGPMSVLVSGFGPKATQLAARVADGYCTTSPDKDLIGMYRSEGGTGPVFAGARRQAHSDATKKTTLRLAVGRE